MDKVLDPVQVKSKGAPKKRMKGFLDKAKKKPRKCGNCKQTGHDRRKCSKYKDMELQMEVKEVTVVKRKLSFDRKGGKKPKEGSAEEEDFIYDYGSDSSQSDGIEYTESRESSSEDEGAG